MSLEIEKKYSLDSAQTSRVCSDLEELKAEFLGDRFEENTLYGGEVLAQHRAILRVRKIGDRAILTYKRRIQSNFDVKQSIEHETEVESAEVLENILSCLGFEKTLVYEKRRRTWKLRDVEVVLDELPFGLYMEIEGSMAGIGEAEMYLGAEDFEVVHETYPNLTSRFGNSNGGMVEARFKK